MLGNITDKTRKEIFNKYIKINLVTIYLFLINKLIQIHK